ncbi:glycosyltransferase family 39 protein [Candidatus Woesebacteria bacterium]|nr:glycosyltransferase family 39 protein [Candidatus Woesebacteria bacterium]
METFPSGFHIDEVRVGWNAYSILKTGRDDRENFLPLYYNTFGDFRPTGIFYIDIFSIILFGLNEFSVRLPSSFVGALTIFPLYFFTLEITKKKEVALFSSTFLAFSPWHISVSRATSEVVISMFLSLLSFYFLIYAINKKGGGKYLIFSFITLIASYFFYHSIRVTAPIFSVFIIYYYLTKIKDWSFKKGLIFFVVFVSLISFFLVFSKSGKGRFSQVSVFNSPLVKKEILNENKMVVYGRAFFEEYLKYFSGEFLIFNDAKPLRYRTPSIGLITYFEFVFLISGIVFVIQKKGTRLTLILLLFAPLVAAITNEDSPNLHRSLFMLPFISILCAYGANYFLVNRKIIFNFLILGFLFNFFYFFRIYTTSASTFLIPYRNVSAKSLVSQINQIKGNYGEVVITNDPDDPYPWFAFYNKIDPKIFNEFAVKRSEGEWKYQNLLFSQKECPSGDIFSNRNQKSIDRNILVIDGFKCAIESKIHDGIQAQILTQIKNSDGTIAYTFWINKKTN